MKAILEKRIVPVAVIDDVANAVPLAEALLAATLNVIEVTFRTASAADSIRRIRQKCPEMLVGAGTILDTDQLQRAVDAGAQFGVSPGLNETVVAKANQLRLPFTPGVMTPSEVERALALGGKLLKFFPAETAGGIKMLKAFAGPYAHTGVKFIPLGGISAQNAGEYLAQPIVAAIGGTWIAERKLVQEKQWAAITKLTREALEIAAKAKAG
jgi:2-dehydro-3-deoxyphosphogluconate aldolase / (4S)-4-hydroxy-2-oxoglutarate aldolase